MSYRGNCLVRVGTTSLEKLADILGSFSPDSYECDMMLVFIGFC
jgi:hypothetical protein